MPCAGSTYIVCNECDLLQQKAPVPPGGTVRCRRCNGILYRNSPDSLDKTLAFTLTSAVLFVVANIYPIMGIEMIGNPSETNLFGAVQSLWDQGMPLISTLVGITTIFVPAAELSLMMYLLLPLRFSKVPSGVALVLRILQQIRPWGMVEVFMVGILVSLVKLTSSSTIIPGVALWSFGGLTFMLAAMTASFNPREIWCYLEVAAPTDHDEEY